MCLASGEGWREIHATPLRETNETLLWNGYVADITERKLMESSLREKVSAMEGGPTRLPVPPVGPSRALLIR